MKWLEFTIMGCLGFEPRPCTYNNACHCQLSYAYAGLKQFFL